ncbi:MAG TPA: hypothetical protein VGD07_02185 [Methylomirabilota bacterium]
MVIERWPKTKGIYSVRFSGMLAWWHTIAPEQARHEVIAAAEAVDSKAEHLAARSSRRSWPSARARWCAGYIGARC